MYLKLDLITSVRNSCIIIYTAYLYSYRFTLAIWNSELLLSTVGSVLLNLRIASPMALKSERFDVCVREYLAWHEFHGWHYPYNQEKKIT